MKKTLMVVLLLASCGADPFVARDDEPRHCAHEYPVDTPPDFCESSAWGDCCSWEDVETDDGICRLDYCAAYNDPQCSWSLQYQDCVEE